MFREKQSKSSNIYKLYLLIPLIVLVFINYKGEEDMWYIMKYGEYFLKHGIFHTDFFSIHQSFHIVVQQPLTCIIFYLLYKFIGGYGFFLLLEVVTGLIIFFLYKLCMVLSDNRPKISSIITAITVVLLETAFIVPRSQVFTYLHLIILLYIMEKFMKDNNTKLIYILPIISILQINLHGAFWMFLFIFMLPYIAELLIKKNKNIYKILLVMLLMFICGFINPYTYENVFFIFKAYGNYDMNHYINELMPLSITSDSSPTKIYSCFFYLVVGTILTIYIYHKKGKLELRHFLLFFGTFTLSLLNLRLTALFYIGAIPFLANYLKDLYKVENKEKIDTKKIWIVMIIFILIVPLFMPNKVKSLGYEGGKYLVKNYDKSKIVLFNELNEGSYFGYIGIKHYIDTRAEVFVKKVNKKDDVLHEMVRVQEGNINYDKFISKYNFTHFQVYKNSNFYNYLKSNSDKYKICYKEKDYVIFVKIST